MLECIYPRCKFYLFKSSPPCVYKIVLEDSRVLHQMLTDTLKVYSMFSILKLRLFKLVDMCIITLVYTQALFVMNEATHVLEGSESVFV